MCPFVIGEPVDVWADILRDGHAVLAAELLWRPEASHRWSSRLRFAQIDDKEVIGFVKESIDGHNAVAVAIALSREGPREFWFHFGDIEIGPSGSQRRVKSVQNLITGEQHTIEWGGVRLRIDQQQDPAVLLRCLA
jgi:starch synthase (maltosyl-transferring)